MANCIPFLRVADIGKTIKWYESIGFKCLGTHQEPGCELDWAMLDLEGAMFMLYPYDRDTPGLYRDAGLYFNLESIDGWQERLQGKAQIIDVAERTEYGKKEIVFIDMNGFQVTVSCEPG